MATLSDNLTHQSTWFYSSSENKEFPIIDIKIYQKRVINGFYIGMKSRSLAKFQPLSISRIDKIKVGNQSEKSAQKWTKLAISFQYKSTICLISFYT